MTPSRCLLAALPFVALGCAASAGGGAGGPAPPAAAAAAPRVSIKERAGAGGADGLFFHSDGGSWTPVAALRGVAVTSLDLDPDGRTAWVGTRAHGLFRVEGDRALAALPADDRAAPEDIVGTAVTKVGT